VPAEFKRHIEEKYGTRFYITSENGKNGEGLPDGGMGKDRAEIGGDSQLQSCEKKFMDLVNYYGQVSEIDAQGRLLVPRFCVRRPSKRRRGGVRDDDLPGSHQP